MLMPMPAVASPAARPSTLVDPAAFAAAVAQPGTVTIDVHIPFEGKLSGTDLVIPYNQIAQQAAELPANRGTTLAIYCRSGNMSAIAAPALAALGYTHIIELKGGMQAWQASGRTLLTTP
jgi:rhodanese-related sulfurtransferase